MDKEAPAVIARTWTDAEASVIKSLLESYNIPCYYMSELPHRIYPVQTETSAGGIRIYVPASLEKEALQILAEHRRDNGSLHLVEDDGPGPAN